MTAFVSRANLTSQSPDVLLCVQTNWLACSRPSRKGFGISSLHRHSGNITVMLVCPRSRKNSTTSCIPTTENSLCPWAYAMLVPSISRSQRSRRGPRRFFMKTTGLLSCMRNSLIPWPLGPSGSSRIITKSLTNLAGRTFLSMTFLHWGCSIHRSLY